MATQTDGVLVQDWSNFAQQMLAQYASAKLVNPNSVVPKSDTAVIAPTQTPTQQVASIGGFIRTPVGMAVAAGALLLLAYVVKRAL